MISVNFENVHEETTKPKAGGYILKIVNTDLRESQKGVIVECDIAEGEFAGYYANLNSEFGFWGLSAYKSYKPKALYYFEKFVNYLIESNPGYKWDCDETKWHGLKIGGIIGYEEYRANNGEIKTRAIITDFCSVQDIELGFYSIPELKRMPQSNPSVGVVNKAVNKSTEWETVNDDDLPL